jgi:hypothetical protein
MVATKWHMKYRGQVRVPAAAWTYLAGEVKLNGLDANVGGTSSHVCGCLEWCEEKREVCVGEGGDVHTAGLSTLDATRQWQGTVQ